MKIKSSPAVRVIIISAVVMFLLSLALLFAAQVREDNNRYITIDPDTIDLVQLRSPEKGDPTATVVTSLGQFSFVLYPDKSPKAVENFIRLAESGYYDDTFVFNSDSGVYAGMGSKERSGELAADAAGSDCERVPRELSQDLWPFKGAVMMMNTSLDRTFSQKLLGGGEYYNGSRFIAANTIEFTDDMKKEMLDASDYTTITDVFIEKGGIPNFSQQMTVIGQTYEGLEVVEALSSLQAQSNGYYMNPDEDVKIISVTIGEYGSSTAE